MLSGEEIKRYDRQLRLPGFGEEAQLKLKSSSVLVAGAGGLGCPALLYLAAAGFGKIGIADGDTVSASNLQRQVLFDDADIGQNKARVAALKIQRQNPWVTVASIEAHISRENALSVFRNYDFILDCTDNFETRYLISDACVLTGRTLVSAAIFRYEGQLMVLHAPLPGGNRSPDYRMVFPASAEKKNNVDCSTAGVFSALPGIMGTMQAAEAVKLASGTGVSLVSKLLLFDVRSMTSHCIDLPAVEKAPGSFPANEAEFARWQYVENNSCELAEIEPQQLAKLLTNETPLLLDVRMPGEWPEPEGLQCENIPLPELEAEAHRLADAASVVVICRSGARSKKACELLHRIYPGKKVLGLRGGVENWNAYYEQISAH